VPTALAHLSRVPAETPAAAERDLATRGFAYMKVHDLNPVFADLLGLRRLLGLRSPLNTVARLLNPADAAASVDGVFHPPYIDVHIAAAEMLGRQRLLVLKGGGGEAERNPSKDGIAHLFIAGEGRREVPLACLTGTQPGVPEPAIETIWRGTAHDAAIAARITGTIALGLLALGQGGDAEAQSIWENRRPGA